MGGVLVDRLGHRLSMIFVAAGVAVAGFALLLESQAPPLPPSPACPHSARSGVACCGLRPHWRRCVMSALVARAALRLCPSSSLGDSRVRVCPSAVRARSVRHWSVGTVELRATRHARSPPVRRLRLRPRVVVRVARACGLTCSCRTGEPRTASCPGVAYGTRARMTTGSDQAPLCAAC